MEAVTNQQLGDFSTHRAEAPQKNHPGVRKHLSSNPASDLCVTSGRQGFILADIT